jgi:hypothetical protein
VTARRCTATPPLAGRPAQRSERVDGSHESPSAGGDLDAGRADIGITVDHADQHVCDPSSIAARSVDPLVELIRSEPGMAERLLGAHADDGTGRCRVCSTGAQAGRVRWPCTIHHRAHQARQDSVPPAGSTRTPSDR